MNNPDVIKIMARSKVRLTAVFALMLILVMAAGEYFRLSRPLAQAVVVLLPQRGEENDILQTAGDLDTAAAKENDGDKESVRPLLSAEAFVGYLQEVNERAIAVVKPELALEKVVLPKEEAVRVEPERNVINERVIEVFDENGEVMEIVEVRGEIAAEDVLEDKADESVFVQPVATVVESAEGDELVADGEGESLAVVESASAQPVAEESVVKEDVTDEIVVNTQENAVENVEIEDGAPAIDMMKEIIERQEAGEDKK